MNNDEIYNTILPKWQAAKPSHAAQGIRAKISTMIETKNFDSDELPDYVWQIADIAAQMGIDYKDQEPLAKQLADRKTYEELKRQADKARNKSTWTYEELVCAERKAKEMSSRLNGLDIEDPEERVNHIMYQYLEGLNIGEGNREGVKQYLIEHFRACRNLALGKDLYEGE